MKTNLDPKFDNATARLVFLDDVLAAIANVRERVQREQDQALLKQSLENARWALAQRDCCDQIEREIQWTAARAAKRGQG